MSEKAEAGTAEQRVRLHAVGAALMERGGMAVLLVGVLSLTFDRAEAGYLVIDGAV